VLTTMSETAAAPPYRPPPSLVDSLLHARGNHSAAAASSSTSAEGAVPEGCKSWNDGCNTCLVTDAGEIRGCTYMACIQQGPPFCQRFADGRVCGDAACSVAHSRQQQR
jgi:hypothetical protein